MWVTPIIERYETQGKGTWDRYYAPRHALNLGMSGDRTEHVLWRLDHANLAGLAPTLAIVMIGQNNAGHNTAEEIGAGVTAVVQKIRPKLPTAKLLLLAVFPRHAKPTKERAVLAKASRIAAQLADNHTIFYMDINWIFLRPDGSIPAELMPDFEHPSAKAIVCGPRPSNPQWLHSWATRLLLPPRHSRLPGRRRPIFWR
jgi:lysophospholipase L1-like esterase